MLIKNTGSKVIGFGKTRLLPGETKELPLGYDSSHPVISFLSDMGFIEIKPEIRNLEIDDLNSMKVAELRTYAKTNGILFTSTDTRDILIRKIIDSRM